MWYFIFFFCLFALSVAASYFLFYRHFNSKSLALTADASSDAIAIRVANNTNHDIYLNAAGIFYTKYKIHYHGRGQFSTRAIYDVSPLPSDIDLPAFVCKYSAISFSLRNPPVGAAGIYIDFSNSPLEGNPDSAYKKSYSIKFLHRVVQRYSKSRGKFYYRVLQTMKICR